MHWKFTIKQLPEVAKELIHAMGNHKVVALYGQMGSGKTTLVHAICDAFGIRDAVGSPTFSIINEYSYNGGSVFHIDCYRLRNEAEAVNAGVEDCLYSGEWCFVEWPEKIPNLLPAVSAILKIGVVDTTTRSLDLEIKS